LSTSGLALVRTSLESGGLLPSNPSPEERDEGLRRLAADIHSGAWAEQHRGLVDLEALDLGDRLIVAAPHSGG